MLVKLTPWFLKDIDIELFSIQDSSCSATPPVTLGCCWNTTSGKYDSFSGGEYDELAFWDRRLIKNGTMNELVFLMGGYSKCLFELRSFEKLIFARK
jgi:hypothetical protein